MRNLVNICGGMMLAVALLASPTAWAGDFDAAIAAVDAEASNMDADTRAELVDMLSDASLAAGEEQAGMVDAFRMTVEVYDGSLLTDGSAVRILAAAASL